MAHKLYKLTYFKRVNPVDKPYGAQTAIEPLGRACRRLVKKFGLQAPVRIIAPGHYGIADGAAELEALR